MWQLNATQDSEVDPIKGHYWNNWCNSDGSEEELVAMYQC